MIGAADQSEGVPFLARPIRVALDARIYGSRGIGRYTETLHKGLLARPDRVSVIAFGRSTDGRPGTWRRLGLPGYVAQEQIELSRHLAGAAFDLVHLTGNTAPVFRAGWPTTIVTVHDILYLKSPRELPLSRSGRQTLGRLYRIGAFLTGTLWVNHLISDSQTTAADLARTFGRRLPPVTVIPCAVDPSFIAPPSPSRLEPVLTRYGLRHRRYFLHPGAVDPRKNTRTVVEAFQRYRASNRTEDLVIIGLPTREREVLEVLPGVRALPFVPNAEVVELFKGALAVIYVPSAEGFGYPLIEAMAAGTPAIVSSIAVLRESARGAAIETPPGDASALAAAMHEAIARPERMAELSRDGRARAADFGVDRMTESVIAVYERVLRERSSRRGRVS